MATIEYQEKRRRVKELMAIFYKEVYLNQNYKNILYVTLPQTGLTELKVKWLAHKFSMILLHEYFYIAK